MSELTKGTRVEFRTLKGRRRKAVVTRQTPAKWCKGEVESCYDLRDEDGGYRCMRESAFVVVGPPPNAADFVEEDI